ncbi:MAG: hypothetical protein E7180_06140 [Erysipelotrichaceae bacterium]|nr:hypothetical protein [Erysipelotrichaceae bacterium]
MDNFTTEQKQAIEELKDHIHSLAWTNCSGNFVCEECISTIHKLLSILTMLTGLYDKEFAKEIYAIIGEN